MEEPLLPEEPLLKVGDSIPQPAPVDILESDMEGSIVHYGSIPVGIDWTEFKSVQQEFRPIAGKNKTMVPMWLSSDGCQNGARQAQDREFLALFRQRRCQTLEREIHSDLQETDSKQRSETH